MTYDQHIHLDDPMFAGHAAYNGGGGGDPKGTVSQDAMIEAKGYGESGKKAQIMGENQAWENQYSRDSTIAADPYNKLHFSGLEVDKAEKRFSDIKSRTKLMNQVNDAAHGGDGSDTTGAKLAPRAKTH